MRMVQEVTLEIIYDADEFDAPSRWDWKALTDESDVVVAEAGEPRRINEPPSKRTSKGGLDT